MRVLSINTVHWGSTGRIMHSIEKCAQERGHTAISYAPAGSKLNSNDLTFGYLFENRIASVLSRVSGFQDLFSVLGTFDLIKKIKTFKPDIIHLHNMHEWFLCLPLLFRYIKKANISVVWTFHDCWPFTGKCTHFVSSECDRWKEGCYNCPELHDYPVSCLDMTSFMWNHKKKWFTSIKDLTIVTPSKWLMRQVESSFFWKYNHLVLNNGICRKFFNTESIGKTSERISGVDKKILLGVSSVWNYKKGLDIFLELEKRLNQKYQIILVGIDEKTEKSLPASIKAVRRTNDRTELALLYSMAEVLVNPTREDTFPTVNLEAISCGTPVVTFDVCGSPETVREGCGIVVKRDNIEELIEAIEIVIGNRTYYAQNCRLISPLLDEGLTFSKYVDLYEKIYRERLSEI